MQHMFNNHNLIYSILFSLIVKTCWDITILAHYIRLIKILFQLDNIPNIFISPDRTKEERDERRDLVKQLKLKRTAEPDKHFSIKKGQIICSTGDDNIVN